MGGLSKVKDLSLCQMIFFQEACKKRSSSGGLLSLLSSFLLLARTSEKDTDGG